MAAKRIFHTPMRYLGFQPAKRPVLVFNETVKLQDQRYDPQNFSQSQPAEFAKDSHRRFVVNPQEQCSDEVNLRTSSVRYDLCHHALVMQRLTQESAEL